MKKLFSLPHRYVRGNSFQRQHVLEAIDQFKTKLKWGTKSNSSLIDVGCGTGDVTMDLVEPLLSNNYKSIVGVDISEESVNFAKKTYEGKYPRAKFEVMDIADKDLKVKEEFDHVTSFYCLNYIQDQSRATENIYNMLKPGGDIFLLLMAQCHIYWIYTLIENNPRFKPHIMKSSTYASPYRYSETPAEDFAEVLQKAGFKDITCKANRGCIVYDKYQVDELVAMTDVFKPGTSEDIRMDLKKAFFNTMKELELVGENSSNTQYRFPYNNVIAYAKK